MRKISYVFLFIIGVVLSSCQLSSDNTTITQTSTPTTSSTAVTTTTQKTIPSTTESPYSLSLSDYWTSAIDQINQADSLTVKEDLKMDYQTYYYPIYKFKVSYVGVIDFSSNPNIIRMVETINGDTSTTQTSYITDEDNQYNLYTKDENGLFYKSILPDDTMDDSNTYLPSLDPSLVPDGTLSTINNIVTFQYTISASDLLQSEGILGSVTELFGDVGGDLLSQANITYSFQFNADTKELVNMTIDMKSLMSNILNQYGTYIVSQCQESITFSNINHVTLSTDFKDHMEVDDAPNYIADNPAIILGDTLSGQINYLDDVDYYALDVTEAGEYRVHIDSSIRFDSEFLDDSGNDVITASGNVYTLDLEPGTYYFVLYNDGSHTAPYQLYMNKVSQDDFADMPDDTLYSVGDLGSTTIDNTLNGQIEEQYDKDLFTVSGPMSIDLTFHTDADIKLYIYNQDNLIKTLSDGDEFKYMNTNSISIIAYSPSNELGTYSMDYTYFGPDNDDPDQNTDTIRELSLGNLLQGFQDSSTDVDVFKITITDSGLYGFTLSNQYSVLNIHYDLMDANFQSIEECTMHNYTTQLEPGVYYIKVIFSSGQNMLYTLDFESYVDDQTTTQTIDLQEITTEMSGSFDFEGDVDTYQFTVDSPKTLFIQLNSDYNCQFILKSQDGTVILKNYSFQSLFPSGTYTLDIVSSYYTPIAYTLSITNITEGVDDYPDYLHFPDEYYGVFDLNQVNEIHMDNTKDEDFYRLTITDSGDYAFSYPIEMNSYYIRLYDSNGNVTSLRNFQKIHLTAGNYYIEIAILNSIGVYDLQLISVDSSDSNTEAAITLGQTMESTFNDYMDTDRYTLTIPVDGLYEITHSNNTKITLNDTNYTLTLPTLDHTMPIGVIELKQGTYHLVVLQDQQNYYLTDYSFKIQVSSVSADDYPNTENLDSSSYTSFNETDSISGQLNYEGDIDVFKVVVTPYSHYSLSGTEGITILYLMPGSHNLYSTYLDSDDHTTYYMFIYKDPTVTFENPIDYQLTLLKK